MVHELYKEKLRQCSERVKTYWTTLAATVAGVIALYLRDDVTHIEKMVILVTGLFITILLWYWISTQERRIRRYNILYENELRLAKPD